MGSRAERGCHRAVIQLGSSLRNLCNACGTEELREVELVLPGAELTKAVRAFVALALAELGRERDALAISLAALSRYLPRFSLALARCAAELAPTSSLSAEPGLP